MKHFLFLFELLTTYKSKNRRWITKNYLFEMNVLRFGMEMELERCVWLVRCNVFQVIESSFGLIIPLSSTLWLLMWTNFVIE